MTVNEQIVVELKKMNESLEKVVEQTNATDWKLWIIMNAVCDGLLAQGFIEDDPRKAKK